MNKRDENKPLPDKQAGEEKQKATPGYPLYPESEDIYMKYQKKTIPTSEDIAKLLESNENEKIQINNENDSVGEIPGNDLDIPGSELDDQQENIGNEDEENNYYSLGGDDHDDLDEYK